jgi:hypothetical protein
VTERAKRNDSGIWIYCKNLLEIYFGSSILTEDRSRSASKKKEQPVQEEPVEEVTPDPGYWITTTPSGERVATMMDGNQIPIKQALVCKATDPQTKQVRTARCWIY